MSHPLTPAICDFATLVLPFATLLSGMRRRADKFEFMTIFFANKSIGIHLLRGVLGLAAVIISVWTLPESIWPSVILLPMAIYLLKGCPMCWAIGLVGTIIDVVQRRRRRATHLPR